MERGRSFSQYTSDVSVLKTGVFLHIKIIKPPHSTNTASGPDCQHFFRQFPGHFPGIPQAPGSQGVERFQGSMRMGRTAAAMHAAAGREGDF
jgi:hypothetical protein